MLLRLVVVQAGLESFGCLGVVLRAAHHCVAAHGQLGLEGGNGL